MERASDVTDKRDNTASAAEPVLAKDDDQGDDLGDLFDRYRREIVAFVRRKVGDGPPEPEDVAQQTFVNYAAVRDRGGIQNPRAFLYRTAANIVINHVRRASLGRAHLADERALGDIFGDHDELSPEIVLLNRERFEQVVLAVRLLPRRQRRFLLLHRLQGMSYTEIARRNGVSISTVRRDVEAAVNACAEAIVMAMDDDPD